MVTFEEFQRLDLRVGQIVTAEPIPGAKRLLKVRVSLGAEERTVVAGLAGLFTPRELEGLKVIVAANLEAAIIHGVVSRGMMLGAGCDGKRDVALLTVNKDVANGTRVT